MSKEKQLHTCEALSCCVVGSSWCLYLVQVDLAQGANRQWVVHKLQQLCDLLGGSTEVVQQPGSGGVRLVAQQQGQQQQQGQVQHKHDRTAGPARHVCDEA